MPVLAALVAACGPVQNDDANARRPAATLHGPDNPDPEDKADETRRIAEQTERMGAPGVTEPVYDPRLADQPGQSWDNRAELDADRALGNPPAK